jgi:YHS domain-containing protein
MTRNIFIFLGTFVAGAAIALIVRAGAFSPHAGHEGHPAGGGDYAAMVSNPLGGDARSATASTAPAKAAAAKPVNTVCAICGMPVDPSVPTVEYQGKTIGFGCKMCPPKFKADPDRYGPIYLRNEVITR